MPVTLCGETDTCGEMAESVEGAPLLREYGAFKLHRGFESLSLRHFPVPIGLLLESRRK